MNIDNGIAADPSLHLGVPSSTLDYPRRRNVGGPERAAAPQTGANTRVRAHRSAADFSEVELLPRAHFLAQLHREKRRTDRTNAPLSLVTYRMAQRTESADTAGLAGLLLASKRETDIAGWLGADVLAVICADTGEEGAHRFIDKIDSMSGDLRYSVECATYPDHLFEGLTASPGLAHGPSPLFAEHREHNLAGETYWLKRPLDVVGALVAIILFAPVMLFTALAIKQTSRGPVIFRQTRLGKFGVPFTFYKFRSIAVDNDDSIHRDYVKNLIRGNDVSEPNSASHLYKIKDDPRVTSVGRFIRRTSIDELPQLYNVIKGDISLVGPRPPMPYEAESYQSWHLRRVLDIKPGMTGLWQVEGRSKVPFNEMVRMDLRYIRSCSLALDLRILAKTVLVVLSCDGAS